MKKLMMFAAAMTIAGGAFAQCGEVPVADCALVYDVKISLKTTAGKEAAGSEVPCGESVGAICYRVSASVKWEGFLSSCDCSCLGFQDAEAYLWDTKSQELILVGETLDWVVLNLFDKKFDKVEGFWQIEGLDASVYAAGFGKADSDGLIKDISGNIVALLPAPPCTTGDCADAIAAPCGIPSTQAALLTPQTVGSGTWKMKYNKSASKKSAENGYLPFPKWY